MAARTGVLSQQAYPDGIRFIHTLNDVGRINVDLPRALHDTISSFNIILQPGDSISVPEYQPSVKVSGAVNSPGSVLWQEGRNLGYYLSAAGGFAYTADKESQRPVRERRSTHATAFDLGHARPQARARLKGVRAREGFDSKDGLRSTLRGYCADPRKY